MNQENLIDIVCKMNQENIIDIVCKNINIEKYSINLNEHEINYIKNLTKNNPEIFTDVQKTIDDIMSDGKIDLHDLPKIILLISQIVKSHVIENAVKNIDIISVIRFVMDSLLDSGLLPLPNIELQLIKKIVDSSLDLLKMDTNININIKSNCLKLFCCFK